MDLYHIWCDLQPGVRDRDFADAVTAYLGGLAGEGKIGGWRLTRKKLGLAPPDLGDFHIIIEVRDLAQLDEAFAAAAARREPVESRHFAVNSLVRNARFALYRDFPDPVRAFGEEKF
jgi:hypothetical protein